MKRTLLIWASMACMTVHSVTAQDAAVNKIIEIGQTDNQVMDHLDVLTNRIGGRVIGSNAYDNAVEWVASKFTEWGLEVELQEPARCRLASTEDRGSANCWEKTERNCISSLPPTPPEQRVYNADMSYRNRLPKASSTA